MITKLPASNIDVEMKLIEKRVEVSWQDNVIEANDKSKSDVKISSKYGKGMRVVKSPIKPRKGSDPVFLSK